MNPQFEKYIMKKKKIGRISIPEIQKDFHCSYKDAKKEVDEAVKNGLLIYSEGLYYEINQDVARNKKERTGKPSMEELLDEYRKKPTARQKYLKELKDKIVKYIIHEGSTTISQLQKEFNLPYSDAHKVVAMLVKEEFIVLKDGLVYQRVKQDYEELEDDEDAIYAERKAYLEYMRQELLRRMRRDEEGD